MRFFYSLIFITIIFSCSQSKTNRSELIHFVPESTEIILKTSNLENLKSSINNSHFLQKFSKSNSYKSLEKKLGNLSLLKSKPSNTVLVCFSKNEQDSIEYTLITKYSKDLFKTDSLQNYTEESFTYKKETITKSSLQNNTFYSTIIDSIFITSSSKKVIERSFHNKFNNLDLEKIYTTTLDDKTLSIIAQPNNTFIKSFFIEDRLSLKSFTNHIAVDIDISQNEIFINGITKANDSTKSLINIFKNTIPQENLIQNVVPSNSDGFMSFTFDNYKTFETNLNKLATKDSINNTTPLFDNIVETGIIYEGENSAVVLYSIDVISTKDALLSEQNKVESYRQIDLFEFSKSDLFFNTFSPLISFNQVSIYCQLDNFFVFSNNLDMLQNIIANYQNKTTISEHSSFKDIKEKLSDESSLLMVSNASKLNSIIKKNLQEDSNYKLNSYRTSAIQFIYYNNFAHVNGIIKKSKTRVSANTVSEILNIKLENDLLNNPQFVINHITKQKEIVVQDINNNLYLISNRGKILWKKQLQGPVLGNIEQIDIYKNGRLQLAFATPNRVYIIDRKGNDVAPFPGKFNDKITQPLSVFDYDKNKKYRLLVTQGKHVLMYDSKAKIVKGFSFKSANSDIISQPKHFRIGSKDYITLKTKNKLYILNRIGKTRVNPKSSSQFSNQPIFLYNNAFTTTTKEGNLISIDIKGNASLKNLNLSQTHHITTTSKTLVAQNENKLIIKKNTIELDFGNYSKPKLFYINDKIYVSITDLQAQKIYLYDSQAKLLPNFPVYGKTSISLDNINTDRHLEFVTKGESNSIIIYQIN